MAYEIVWSAKAEETFFEIITYLKLNWTKTRTDEVLNLLEISPLLFKRSKSHAVHQVMIGKQNMLLYDVSESLKRVELLSFWDARQNPESKPH